MKKIPQFLAVMVFGWAAFARADSEIECVKSAGFLAPADAPAHLNYAPDREVTVLHLALNVTPDFKQRTVAGTATLDFKPCIKPAQEIKLDAVDLNVESVTSTEKIQGYQVTAENLIITFANPIPAGSNASVTIKYHCEPDLGLYFRTPEMGYKEGDTHCFSQGEEIEARHWYPCFDSPNEKFTSEITCSVPEGMTVVSNGRLVSQEKDAATGLVVWHWSQEKPSATYLMSLVAGYFSKLEGKHNDVPLAFLVPQSQAADAASSFRETEETMAFFDKEIGVNYPWVKYYQTCVNDFVAGGMENTSCTTLTDSTLFRDETENIRNSQSLVAHEMAHQWFGDYVTCKDWSHIWLNEGFATYYQVLFEGYKNGHDAMLYDLYKNASQVTGVVDDKNSIVRRNYKDPFEMFGYLAYPKGGWVLHMLRSQLGEDLYRKCIKTYLERHAFGNVTTEDLRAVIEELSGDSYDQFFDQYVYHAHHPELEVNYSWDEKTKLARVSIKQVQKTGDNVFVFNIPLTLRFKGKSGSADRVVRVKEVDSEFYFPLEAAPEIVRVDPEYTLLMKVTFNLPSAMLFAQLADQSDSIGRLLAIEQLANKQDKETVAKLKQALNSDSFYGVRVEAARALRSIHSDEALTALLDSATQSDARVRLEVVSQTGMFYQPKAGEFIRKVLDTEKNPLIVSTAIRSLGTYSQSNINEVLVKYLNSESFRESLAGAAISAIRGQDDPAYIAPLMDALKKRETEFPTRVFTQGLGTLAYLARNEEKKDTVREFLTGYLNDKKQSVKTSAINALGTLGDAKAIALLDTFANASKESPTRGAAEKAVADLRAGRKPVDDFKALRTELTDLEKSNKTLTRELEDLKKKIEVGSVASTKASTNSPATPAKKGKKAKDA